MTSAGWPGDLQARAAWALDAYRDCRLCPRDCGVDRTTGADGFCRLGVAAPCYKALLSWGEEAVLTPTVLLDLGGCSLRCLGCSEWDHVVAPDSGGAVALDASWLEPRLTAWIARGARSMTLVGGEPSMHLYGIFAALAALPASLQLPLVWNSNGLLSAPARAQLLDVVACWVIDAKVDDDDQARRLLGAGAMATVREVEATIDAVAAGPATHAPSQLPRLILRHLLLPGQVDCITLPLLRRCAARWPNAQWNLMTGWLPHGPSLRQHAGPAALRQVLGRDERERALAEAAALLGARLWVDGRPVAAVDGAASS